ncbi:hypothetical protein SCB49_04960 [unidentified eubacterium SCB49]|nr:hypothetical protein SCB49_04960 [unidentified eubacterium SCB49]
MTINFFRRYLFKSAKIINLKHNTTGDFLKFNARLTNYNHPLIMAPNPYKFLYFWTLLYFNYIQTLIFQEQKLYFISTEKHTRLRRLYS